MQPFFPSSSVGGSCLESAGFLEKRERKQGLLVGLQRPPGSQRDLGDVLQHRPTAAERRAEEFAFMPGCYRLTVETTKGKASCLHKRKRVPGLEMGVCRAAKPTGVWLSPTNTEEWWHNHRRAEGQMCILNPSKYASVLCCLKLREIGFESNLFALSFTWAGKL